MLYLSSLYKPLLNFISQGPDLGSRSQGIELNCLTLSQPDCIYLTRPLNHKRQ